MTGKYKTWYHVRDGNNEDRSIGLGNIEQEKIRDTGTNVTTVTASDKKTSQKPDIIMAKENELDKLSQFNTYEEVEASGQEILSTRWVITTKERNTKAILVVRGFEEKDIEIPRDSPTASKGAMRIFLTVVAHEQWTVKTTDIKSAFLSGKELYIYIYIYIH